jgi:aspartate aminotransferase-like enzyme
VLADLKDVFGTDHEVLPLVASGTGAMESSVSNFFSPGDKVIVCSAGKFGERWVDLTSVYGLDAIVLEAPYGDVVAPERVHTALKSHPEVRGVFVQASETSTGASHDVRGMAEAVRASDAIFVIDAITGLGTQPLDIDGWGLDVVIGGSQKAFMIPPGMAFLSVSPKAWAFNSSAKLPRYYFDLAKERKSAAAGETSWTPAISVVLALAEALKYIKQIGMANLIENAQQLAAATRAAVTELGLELFAPHAPAASVTAVRAPRGMDSGVLIREFRNRFGSILTNGQGSMKGQIFRIAHIGYFDFPDLFSLIAQLEIVLAANGIPVRFGSGVAAAQEVYAEKALAVAL